MNTLIFFAGVGLGIFVSTLFFIIVLAYAIRGNRKPSDYEKERDNLTAKLLTERNAIDSKTEKHLSALASWANENWKR